MNKKEIFEKIAKGVLGIETLEPRNRDSLDFHEVSVWGLEAALEAAYRAGKGEELMIGKIVKNDGKDLAELLGGTKLQHLGHFTFSLKIKGKTHKVFTDPIDDENEHLKICRIWEI